MVGTCIHQPAGLCPECAADEAADPLAWIGYGNHPEGLRRWAELQDEIAASHADEPPVVLTAEEQADVPF